MHTRFEHSLGVMHIATQLFDAVRKSSADLIKAQGFTETELERDRILVRLTALLHDVGHGPFSHAAEDVLPKDEKGKHFKHEAYSAAAIRYTLPDVIDNHPGNIHQIKAEEVASFLEQKISVGKSLNWSDIISSQMDADRMDYLLRDSLHTGVDYGKYDWRRILNTVQLVIPEDDEGMRGFRFGISKDGIHAAEALVLARYYMFTQVYFHKTRVSYDLHYRHALKELLPGGAFPKPTETGLQEYLSWDDWKVLGLLSDINSAGEHGVRLRERNHFRQIYHTSENADRVSKNMLQIVKNSLGTLVAAEENSKTSTYKLDASDIYIADESDKFHSSRLSEQSPIVKSLNQNPINIFRIYSKPENAENARSIVAGLTGRNS
jgi:uncharacterized protein